MVLKASLAFILVIVAGFCAMAFAFNGERATYKNNSALNATSLSGEEEVKGVKEILTIYDNIFINNISVGGLKKDEAERLLNGKLSNPFDGVKLTFSYDNNDYNVQFNQIKAGYNIKAAVEEAYSYAREQDEKKNEQKIKGLDRKKYEITMPIVYDADLLLEEINKIGEELNIPAKEPTFKRADGEFSITKEEYGKRINIEQAQKQADSFILEGKSGKINLILEEVAPRYTAAEFSKATDLIGTFSTSFSAGDNGRNTNIKNATSKINDTVLLPGEVFSTNDAFGDMTYDNGYRMASTIVGGKLEDGMGGGVCQVSSTLYNAVLYSELEIVERTNHSLKVGYTDWGFDATLAGNYIDLKFKNNTEYPVVIEGYTTSNTVVVNIYGYEIHNPGRKLVFENALVKSTPPAAEVVKEDPSLPEGQRVEDIKSRTGYVYAVYKLVYEDGNFIEKVQVNTSSYKATRGEIRVGTGPKAPEPLPTETGEPPSDGVTPPATDTPDMTEAQDITQTPLPNETSEPEPQSSASAEQLPAQEPDVDFEQPIMP